MFTSIKLLLGKLNINLLTLTLIISLAVITFLWRLEITRHKLTVSEYDMFKAELHSKAIQNALELKLKDEIHVKELDKQAKDYQANIEHLKLDRAKIQKGLQNEINRTGSLLNDVRVYQKRTSDAGLSKDESTTILSTEERTDCNATIAQLVDAGKSCAVDYNALYDAWLAQCNIYGCTE